ncbi:DUF3224 domain-containing protein [uncultured Ferrimonas sp.]|uniref:DUF3224 domain-containing protein n=1 Tax=uncultured Ferrimonas sp. TaxID=432640 RepID=UPI00262D7B51|nr:DUF3224 domain-containing protein [uncultured Ferrimonas sp.]
MEASGTFTVSLSPLGPYAESSQGIQLGRMSIDKTFSGDLSANSKGEMLNAMAPIAGSAGYVAIELVSGVLQQKSGSFALQHYGTMAAGAQHLVVEVVPGSGVGELSGLSGIMTIRIEAGQHFYHFDYQL